MRKIFALTLAVLMLLALAACGKDANTPTTTASGNKPPVVDPDNSFCFTYEGVKLIPGAVFDGSKLPAVESADNPDCVGSGKFTTYYHDPDMELTTNTNGGHELIYSIYIVDPNCSTDEGLYLGDTAQQVTQLYGEDCEKDEGLWTYRKGNTLLVILIEDDLVTSIEFKMA